MNLKSFALENVNLAEYARNCALLEKWSQLGEVGDQLAKAPAEPWGAYYLSVSALGLKQYQRAIWMIDLAAKKAPKDPGF